MFPPGVRRRRPSPRPLPAVTPPCSAPARPAAPALVLAAPAARPAPPAGPLAERSFVAVDGRRWRVREHVVHTDDAAPRRLLVFECRHVLRWLRDFPADWHRRGDAELEALSWRI